MKKLVLLLLLLLLSISNIYAKGNVTYDNLKFPRRMIEDNPKKDYSKYKKYVII